MPDRQDVRLKLMEIYSARRFGHFEATLTGNAVNWHQQGRIHLAARVDNCGAGFGPKTPLIHEAEELPSVAPCLPPWLRKPLSLSLSRRCGLS